MRRWGTRLQDRIPSSKSAGAGSRIAASSRSSRPSLNPPPPRRHAASTTTPSESSGGAGEGDDSFHAGRVRDQVLDQERQSGTCALCIVDRLDPTVSSPNPRLAGPSVTAERNSPLASVADSGESSRRINLRRQMWCDRGGETTNTDEHFGRQPFQGGLLGVLDPGSTRMVFSRDGVPRNDWDPWIRSYDTSPNAATSATYVESNRSASTNCDSSLAYAGFVPARPDSPGRL